MSTTPRTDAKVFTAYWPSSWNRQDSGPVVDADFARELEGEIERLEQAVHELNSYDAPAEVQSLRAENARLTSRLEAVQSAVHAVRNGALSETAFLHAVGSLVTAWEDAAARRTGESADPASPPA